MKGISFREFVRGRVEKVFEGKFWTRFHEILDDIEGIGYIVEFATEESIEISIADYDHHFLLYLGQAGSTMWITKVVEA